MIELTTFKERFEDIVRVSSPVLVIYGRSSRKLNVYKMPSVFDNSRSLTSSLLYSDALERVAFSKVSSFIYIYTFTVE